MPELVRMETLQDTNCVQLKVESLPQLNSIEIDFSLPSLLKVAVNRNDNNIQIIKLRNIKESQTNIIHYDHFSFITEFRCIHPIKSS